MDRFPLLPLEEEGRLNDMLLRENFVERVLPVALCDRAYGGKPGFPLGSLPAADCTTAWTKMLDKEPTPGGLVKFHTAHKLTREGVDGLLRAMAHGHWASPVPWHYTDMARRAAGAAWLPMRASGIGMN